MTRDHGAWVELADYEFRGWLVHLRGILPRMDEWITKHHVNFGYLNTPQDRFAMAMYNEIVNVSLEAQERLKTNKEVI